MKHATYPKVIIHRLGTSPVKKSPSFTLRSFFQLNSMIATLGFCAFRLPFVAIVASSILACAVHAEAPSDKPTFTGKFLGDGKDAKIQHLIVQPCDPFSGQPAIQLIFTEEDPSASKKPEFDAGFKKLGNALVISVKKDGGIFGCEVIYLGHKKSPFSSVGRFDVKDFKVTDTHISGKINSGGELDFFDQKWELDLTFSAPLPKGAFAVASEPPSTSKKEDPEQPAEPAGPKLPVAKIPLPTGALDIEYKQSVEFIIFRSDSVVSVISKDFAAKLKAQGWKDGSGSLIGKTNTILQRKLNDAELTIMIQPAGKGCTVKVITKGLDWSDTPASAPEKPAKIPAKTPDADSIEAEAKRQIQDALKQIPKF